MQDPAIQSSVALAHFAFFARKSFVPIYTPYFVKFPNKNWSFRRFFGLVYPFTYIYTKNVWELPSG